MTKAEESKPTLNNFEIIDGEIVSKGETLKPREGITPFKLHDTPQKKSDKSDKSDKKESHPRWKGGSFLKQDQATDEKYQTDTKIS